MSRLVLRLLLFSGPGSFALGAVAAALAAGGAHERVDVDCRQANGAFTLSISDGGLGFPPGFDPASSKGLGMMLITSLTEQLGGRMQVRRENDRTAVSITVPVPAAAKLAHDPSASRV